MIDNFEFEDKFNPWTVTSLDDFLFYCCPECDIRSVTKSEFIQHAVNNHPRSQNIIDSLEDNQELPKSVTESENNLTGLTNDVNSYDVSEEMETEKSKPEFVATKVNHEIVEVKSNNEPNERVVPLMNKAEVFKCQKCDKEFINQDNYKSHLITHIKSVKKRIAVTLNDFNLTRLEAFVYSDKCDKDDFENEEFYDDQIKTEHSQDTKLLKTPKVELNRLSEESINDYTKPIQNSRSAHWFSDLEELNYFSCNFCTFYGQTLKSMSNHAKKNHGSELFKMKHWRDIATKLEDPNEVIKTKQIANKRYNCDKCDKTCSIQLG